MGDPPGPADRSAGGSPPGRSPQGDRPLGDPPGPADRSAGGSPPGRSPQGDRPRGDHPFTSEQAEAISRRRGDLLLDAGAGSGKTSVLVERFVRAVLEDGVEVGAILAITFTEKAAGELRERIGARLRELGARDRAREAESAYVSTIHGFCARVLRTHALAAGLDPAFAVLDQAAAEELAERAFAGALEDLAASAPGGVELIAAYGPAALHEAILATHGRLRSRGEAAPRLPALGPAPALAVPAAALRDAAAGLAAELGAIVAPGVRVGQALERLAEVGAVLAAAEPWPGELDRIALPGGNGAALATPACVAYAEALSAVRRACEHRRALAVHALLDRLLRDFATRYAVLKRERSGLDFEDLELLACRLLERPELGERYRTRFAHVMVDELQDTNRVQLALIELLAAGNLFTVGDAQQSIYGFRHAEVELFERRGRELEARGARATLRTNFRSHPQILTALNGAFATAVGERFRPLRAGRGDADPGEPLVELLIADKGADWLADGLAAPWRLAEARALARRVAELRAHGVAPGEVVVLTRATTDLRAYERALEALGIPTYMIGGRGYWSHPQVIDVVAYLRTLANPRDEEALLTVLASPLHGLDLDGVLLLAAAARAAGTDLWSLLRDPGERLGELGAAEREPLGAFVAWLVGERAQVTRLGVPELIERALDQTGYDLAVLARPGGERALANVRKLTRLGGEHELAGGPDLPGFLALAARRAAGGPGGGESRESEAPVESEGLDAVRLMTIHRAKGLEFPVVCVADLGRSPIRFPELIRVGADGRFGLRLSEPGSGRAEPALDYAALGEAQLRAEREEERRLFYVAMTRARERLILSGAAGLDKLAAGPTPIAWIAPALIPELATRTGEVAGVGEGGVAFRFVRPTDDRPAAAAPPPSAPPAVAPPAAASALPRADSPAAASALPEADPSAAAAPAPPPVTTLSYSALAAYRRCGYRFYAERVLGLPPGPTLPPPDTSPEAVSGAARDCARLPAAERGVLVHGLLERLDFRRPAIPEPEAVIAAAPGARPGRAEAERIVALIERFAAGELCARLGRAGSVQREQRFAFPLAGEVMVTGALDVLARERGGGLLIVDYKSDALAGRDPASLVEGVYAAQRLIYALAALRGSAPTVEVAHVFLERPEAPVVARFTAARAPALEAELRRLAGGVLAGEFHVSEEPRRALCDGCPALDGLCSWPAESTRREAADRLI